VFRPETGGMRHLKKSRNQVSKRVNDIQFHVSYFCFTLARRWADGPEVGCTLLYVLTCVGSISEFSGGR